jgi:hypothetical protein
MNFNTAKWRRYSHLPHRQSSSVWWTSKKVPLVLGLCAILKSPDDTDIKWKIKTVKLRNEYKWAGTIPFGIFRPGTTFRASCSPKSRADLQAAAATVTEQIHKIRNMLNTRWASSSFNTVTAVFASCQCHTKHFRQPAMGLIRWWISGNLSGLTHLCAIAWSPHMGKSSNFQVDELMDPTLPDNICLGICCDVWDQKVQKVVKL